MLIKIILANYIANEMLGIQEGDEMSHNLTDHFELYFPDEKLFFPLKIYQWNAH
jgi:hypothetical protein